MPAEQSRRGRGSRVELGPLGVRLLVERLAHAAVVADVVHEHVDAAELVVRGRHERECGVRFADVADDRRPCPRRAQLRLAARSASISANTTRPPSATKRSTTPRPIPPPPPVTIATLPARSGATSPTLRDRVGRFELPKQPEASQRVQARAISSTSRTSCTGWKCTCSRTLSGTSSRSRLVVERDDHVGEARRGARPAPSASDRRSAAPDLAA